VDSESSDLPPSDPDPKSTAWQPAAHLHMADSLTADSVLAETPTMDLTEGFEQAGFGSDNAPWFAHPTVQKAVQFFPVIVMLIMQIYFHTRGPIKGKKKTLKEAADAADPTVFFDITIGGKPAGRIESEPHRMLFTLFGPQHLAHTRHGPH
jgi:hypothetical protein